MIAPLEDPIIQRLKDRLAIFTDVAANTDDPGKLQLAQAIMNSSTNAIFNLRNIYKLEAYYQQRFGKRSEVSIESIIDKIDPSMN